MWRYGLYMNKAVSKYGADNWTKGIPIESYIQSLERHLLKLKMELKYGYTMEEGDHASAIIFNAIIIPLLIPLALKGVAYKPIGASALLRRNLLIYGLGGVIVPFIGIKLIDLIVSNFF